MTYLTQPEIDRLVTMSRIATYTTEENREYHHGMIDAGWLPVIGTVGVMRWTNASLHTSMDYESAQDFYTAHGQAPAPF